MLRFRAASHSSLVPATVTTTLLLSSMTVTAAGVWQPTGSMVARRVFSTAIPLLSGKVLVAGGEGNVEPGAEVYDPATRTWTPTGTMGLYVTQATAVRLSDGRELIIGGFDYSTSLPTAAAELYNPATNAWRATASMATSRQEESAVTLPNGDVLVAGGFTCGPSSCSVLSSAELYNPATGRWTPTGVMTSPRSFFTLTLLADGDVLAAGGYATMNSQYQASAELYSTRTGQWTAVGSMATARAQHAAVRLADGRVLVAGGQNDSGVLASAEVYSPTTQQWTATGSLRVGRTYSVPLTLLPTGRVLVEGGITPQNRVTASAEVYNPASGTWVTVASMTTPRDQHTATLLANGQVLVAGGDNGHGELSSAEVFTP